jgi:hypothetical protein
MNGELLSTSGVVSCEMISPALLPEAPTDAYELKFWLRGPEAERLEAWARSRLVPDPHGQAGTYRVTTLYLDTAGLDVYFRSPGYRRNKYRIRRYGEGELAHLERKTRVGDLVRKRREVIPLAEVRQLLAEAGAGTWFGGCIQRRLLRPSCWITYLRTAFLGSTSHGPARLTLDRDVRGTTAPDWTAPSRFEGRDLLGGGVVLELKFQAALPGLFRELLESLPARASGASKYRRCVEAWGLSGERR